MFKLLNKNDKNVVLNNMFIKNAGYFQDALAFFDAYAAICEKSTKELPNYCTLSDGTLCLEGVCLFIKTYASEFMFRTIDLSIDYLKIIYYSISSLSDDGKTVSRDLLVNDYLIYKEANKKYSSAASRKIDIAKQEFNKASSVFDKRNNSYAKFFMWSRVSDILATVVVIFSFLIAMFPAAFYYAERITLKSAIIYAGAVLLIGLILRFEFKIISKYLSEQAMEQAYLLQNLKKERDVVFSTLNAINQETGKILNQNYEFEKGFENLINCHGLDFDEILRLARQKNIKSYNIRGDVLKIDKANQEHIYNIIGKIAEATPEEIGRLENIYGEILSQDYLKFNNYVRLSFLNKFIDNAFVTKNWKLNLSGVAVAPFNIDTKAIAQEKLSYFVDGKNEFINTSLDLFFKSKYAKELKHLKLKNIKNESSFETVKSGYINRFYMPKDSESNKEPNKRQIPKLIEIKLALLQTRLVCNTLGESDFLKTLKVISEYEGRTSEIILSETQIQMIEEKNKQNQKHLRSLFECDEIRYLGDDEVLCIVGDRSFRGFRLSNI